MKATNIKGGGLGLDSEGLRHANPKSVVTLPPSGDCIIAHKYLQEGVHLFLDPVDKPPLDDQAVRGKMIDI